MQPDIKAIFIDLGNTMRILVKDEQHQSTARQKIAGLVGTNEDADVFCQRIDERYKVYRKWAFETWIEAPESELWTRWLLPDFPVDVVAPLVGELTYHFRQSMGRRVMVPGAREVVEELCQRGYLLGIISNVITYQEIPDWLEADNMKQYFKAMVLSSHFGRRKPDPEVFWEASRRIGVPPGKCVYVGDNLDRDVTGTRKAGFGMAIILIDAKELEKKSITDENRPDAFIHDFRQLLDLFPMN